MKFVLIACLLAGSVASEAERIKRNSGITLTDEDKRKIVEAHNIIRRREMATDMKRMEWHDGLAAEAQKTVDKCTWAQKPLDDLVNLVEGFETVSELIDVTPDMAGIEKSAVKWAEESLHYHYSTGQCRKVCWHYTQIVWADSYAVGCGMKYCPNLENLHWGQHGGYLISCMYGPQGNSDHKPYRRGGEACSECTPEFAHCYEGLCSRVAPPVTTQATPTTPATPVFISGRPLPIGGASRLSYTFTGLLTAACVLYMSVLI